MRESYERPGGPRARLRRVPADPDAPPLTTLPAERVAAVRLWFRAWLVLVGLAVACVAARAVWL